ncbi:hypothetical protein [Lysobacter gummosus]
MRFCLPSMAKISHFASTKSLYAREGGQRNAQIGTFVPSCPRLRRNRHL